MGQKMCREADKTPYILPVISDSTKSNEFNETFNPKSTTRIYFLELKGGYKAVKCAYDIIDGETFKPTKTKVIEGKSLGEFASLISKARSDAKQPNFWFIVDTNNLENLRIYSQLYCSQQFSSVKAFNYITLEGYKTLTKQGNMKSSKEINSYKPVYIPDKEINYITSTIGEDDTGYLHTICGFNANHTYTELDYFTQGNVYVFLDCEMLSGTQVKEISILFTEMQGMQLVPFSKVVCSSRSPVKTCAQFITYFDSYIKELMGAKHLGKVYLVGHGIQVDIMNIYRTLGLTPLVEYDYIDTGSLHWWGIWPDICLEKRQSSISLEVLKEECMLSNELISSITNEIYQISGTRQHTSMFDVTLLLILLNLLLLKKHDLDTYNSFHLSLIKNTLK